MSRNQPIPAGSTITSILVLLSGILLKSGYLTDTRWYAGLLITIPLLVITAYKTKQPKGSSQLREHPYLNNGRDHDTAGVVKASAGRAQRKYAQTTFIKR